MVSIGADVQQIRFEAQGFTPVIRASHGVQGIEKSASPTDGAKDDLGVRAFSMTCDRILQLRNLCGTRP